MHNAGTGEAAAEKMVFGMVSADIADAPRTQRWPRRRMADVVLRRFDVASYL